MFIIYIMSYVYYIINSTEGSIALLHFGDSCIFAVIVTNALVTYNFCQ